MFAVARPPFPTLLPMALLVSGLLSSTFAEEPPTDTVTEELTVVDRATDSTGAVSEKISREDIESSGSRTAAEAVQFTAGLHLLSSGSRGGPSYAQIRGGDPNFTVVLLDGVPLNDVTNVQGGAFNLSTLPVSHLDEIRVLRGPHSYYFGTSAVAGVLSLTTRHGDEGKKGRLEMEAGAHDLARAALSYGSGSELADAFVGGHVESEEGTVGEDSYDEWGLTTSLGRQLGDRIRLRFAGRYADNEIADYPESSGGPTYGSGDLRNSRGRGASGGLTSTLTTGRWHHSGSLTYSQQLTDLDSPAVPPLVPPSTEERDYARSQLNWASQHQISPLLHLALGAQVDREDGDNQSLLRLPDFLGGTVVGDYRIERTTLGAFGEIGIRTGNLSLDLGARADDPEELDTEWSPRLGVAYRLGDSGWRVQASWSQGFKLPSLFSIASPPQLGGNPALRPETSEGLDLGFLFDGKSLHLGVVGFDNRYDDLIDFDFDTFQQINRSRVDAEGLELFARLRATDRLNLALDFTVQDVVDATSGQPLLNEPDWFGSLRLDWHATAAFDVHLDLRVSDGSLDVQLPVPALEWVEGFEVLGLGLRWRLSSALRLIARIDNLTDQEWEQFIGFPQPGRSARAGFVWGFL